MFKNEVQNFRHRGFVPNDGSPVVMIFGDGQAPTKDGVIYTKNWDHDIEQVIKVQDHVEPHEDTFPTPAP